MATEQTEHALTLERIRELVERVTGADKVTGIGWAYHHETGRISGEDPDGEIYTIAQLVMGSTDDGFCYGAARNGPLLAVAPAAIRMLQRCYSELVDTGAADLTARNTLAEVLDEVDGEHSTSIVDCARRAAEIIRFLQSREDALARVLRSVKVKMPTDAADKWNNLPDVERTPDGGAIVDVGGGPVVLSAEEVETRTLPKIPFFIQTVDEPAAAVAEPAEPSSLFCVRCFADDKDGGSWSGGVVPGHCMNCGAGGSVVSIPPWAVKSIRSSASWVGKRYYPSDEDREIREELIALRALVPSFPGRTATEYVDSVTGELYWTVRQETTPGLWEQMTFPRLPGETPADGVEKSRLVMRYMPAQQPLRLDPRLEGARVVRVVACPRAKSDTSPCVLRDGDLAVTDDGRCAGCDLPREVARGEADADPRSMAERIAADLRDGTFVGASPIVTEPPRENATERVMIATERAIASILQDSKLTFNGAGAAALASQVALLLNVESADVKVVCDFARSDIVVEALGQRYVRSVLTPPSPASLATAWGQALAESRLAARDTPADVAKVRAILEKHWSLTPGAPLVEHAQRIMERLRHDHEEKCGVVIENLRQARTEIEILHAKLDHPFLDVISQRDELIANVNMAHHILGGARSETLRQAAESAVEAGAARARERDELMAYVDAAKEAAGNEQISGETLAGLVTRLRGDIADLLAERSAAQAEMIKVARLVAEERAALQLEIARLEGDVERVRASLRAMRTNALDDPRMYEGLFGRANLLAAIDELLQQNNSAVVFANDRAAEAKPGVECLPLLHSCAGRRWSSVTVLLSQRETTRRVIRDWITMNLSNRGLDANSTIKVDTAPALTPISVGLDADELEFAAFIDPQSDDESRSDYHRRVRAERNRRSLTPPHAILTTAIPARVHEDDFTRSHVGDRWREDKAKLLAERENEAPQVTIERLTGDVATTRRFNDELATELDRVNAENRALRTGVDPAEDPLDEKMRELGAALLASPTRPRPMPSRVDALLARIAVAATSDLDAIGASEVKMLRHTGESGYRSRLDVVRHVGPMEFIRPMEFERLEPQPVPPDFQEQTDRAFDNGFRPAQPGDPVRVVVESGSMRAAWDDVLHELAGKVAAVVSDLSDAVERADQAAIYAGIATYGQVVASLAGHASIARPGVEKLDYVINPGEKP